MVDIVGYDESKKKKAVCPQCTAILMYSLSEVKSKIESDYTGGKDEVHYIECPGCKNHVGVPGY